MRLFIIDSFRRYFPRRLQAAKAQLLYFFSPIFAETPLVATTRDLILEHTFIDFMMIDFFRAAYDRYF